MLSYLHIAFGCLYCNTKTDFNKDFWHVQVNIPELTASYTKSRYVGLQGSNKVLGGMAVDQVG